MPTIPQTIPFIIGEESSSTTSPSFTSSIPRNICSEYSGIVIDQNIRTTSLIPGSNFYYQTFRLPEKYLRGDKISQQRYPGLSGFQLLCSISNSQEATLNYFIEENFFGSGWSPLASGTVIGAHATGERVWMDVILDQEIPITQDTAESELRIGFQVVAGIKAFYYAQPNPLAGFVEAQQNDGKALFSPSGSFAFRILGLIADSGTDFLGDPYRSIAVRSTAEAPVAGNSNTGYWLSAPQPSKFAVTSHYSDLRQFPEIPIYGIVNEISDPSFEYDLVGEAPYGWSVVPATEVSFEAIPPSEILSETTYRQYLHSRLSFSSYQSSAKLTVVDDIEPVKGNHCLEVKTEGVQFSNREGTYIGEMPIVGGTPYTFSVWLRAPTKESFPLVLVIGNREDGVSEEVIEITPEWQRFAVTHTSPTGGTAYAGVLVPRTSHRQPYTFYMDLAMFNQGPKAASYIDGDSASSKWSGIQGRSGSIELTELTVRDEPVVIDSVLLNPLFPGVAFNIYYTNDLTGSENENMTEEDWEQKLWIHVPQSFVTSVKTTYALPEPITCKFIKIEFSQLNPQPYEPGDYQKPTEYKLFPDWVALPFLAEIATPNFAAQRVGVVYDALELAYQPLLTDLIQAPSTPEHPEFPVIPGPASNRVDLETLKRIELTINTYLKPPAQRSNPLTILGIKAANTSANQPGYPVEATPEFKGTSTIAVSGLERQAIVLDESIPVMFFWVTCRHEYKEQAARFETNRAYFAGLNELSFIRNQYSVTGDSSLYIESGTDNANAELNDFNVETYNVENNGIVYGEESVWHTY